MSDDPALDALKRKIQDAKKTARKSSFHDTTSSALAGKFFNVGAELIAGVLVGVGLGILIDWGFGTSPWGLISFFIMGSAAGMLNVYRALASQRPKDNKKETDD